MDECHGPALEGQMNVRLITGYALAVLLLLGKCVAARGDALHVSRVDEQFVFGGGRQSVFIPIENSGAELQSLALQARLFQASSAVLAPVAEKFRVAESVFPPGQKTLVPIAFEAPEAGRITSYVLKAYAAEDEIGSVKVRICPTNLLAGIKRLVPEVALFESGELLGSILAQSGIPVTGMEADSTPARLMLVRLASAADEKAWSELDPPAGSAVLFIVSPGVTGAEQLMPLKFSEHTHARAAILQDWFVPDISRSPLSQLRLLRAIDLLMQPGTIKTPSNPETK